MKAKELEKLSKCVSLLCDILEELNNDAEIIELTKGMLYLNELEHKLNKKKYNKKHG
ncbi:MAG: hypothetical protein WC783_04400 [Candidatus Paceibacterota bacterium]|jgi:hypothetical protein